jgi:hypothetical protein
VTLPPFRLQRRPRATAELPGRPGRETLCFPLPVPSRLALVDTGFHVAVNMRGFAANDVSGLIGYAPDAMALPLAAVLSLADRTLRGVLELPSLKFAIVVLSSLDPAAEALITAHHRDLLWKAFGLPVFEQLRGWDGRVIARECEVHDGLHFNAEAVQAEVDGDELIVIGARTGFSGEIVLTPCECGVETPRLRHLMAPVMATRTRAAAA